MIEVCYKTETRLVEETEAHVVVGLLLLLGRSSLGSGSGRSLGGSGGGGSSSGSEGLRVGKDLLDLSRTVSIKFERSATKKASGE